MRNLRQVLWFVACSAVAVGVVLHARATPLFVSDADSCVEELQVLWRAVNNSLLSPQQRGEAERALIRANDARILQTVFRSLVEPIEVVHLPNLEGGSDLRIERLPRQDAIRRYFPSGGSPEADAHAPVASQIAYARGRIWRALAAHSVPEQNRNAMYLELYNEAETEEQVYTLIQSAPQNWNETVRQRMLNLYSNRDVSAQLRYRAARMLFTMHHSMTRAEFASIRESVIATAWSERGSDLAVQIGDLLSADDVRARALILDWYDYETHQAAAEGRPVTGDVVRRIDHKFGNVSGMSTRPSIQGTAEERERQERVASQWREAIETRDDSNVRDHHAELAERQRQELETRIERIDAWIAANRERLEQEAVAFAHEQQRRRELRRTGEQ